MFSYVAMSVFVSARVRLFSFSAKGTEGAWDSEVQKMEQVSHACGACVV